MNTTIDRLKIFFLGLFAVGVVAIWVYQIFWVWPAKSCESKERWWDPLTRTCAVPIYIPDRTGRPAGMSREDWSKQQARKKILQEQYGPGAEPPEVKVPPKAEAKPAAKAATK